MGYPMTRGMTELVCPSCETLIRIRHTENHVAICPKCGEWLIRKSWHHARPDRFANPVRIRGLDDGDDWQQWQADEDER